MKLKQLFLYRINIPSFLLIIMMTFSALGVLFTVRKFKSSFIIHRLIHPIRQRYIRLPSVAYLTKNPPENVAGYVREFEQKGLVRLPNFLSNDQLVALKADFGKFITYIDEHAKDVVDKGDGFTQDYFDKTDSRYCSSNPFKYSSLLVSLCCNEKLVDIVNHYFKADAHINFGVATRLISGGTPGLGSYQWHHDAWGKKVHIMFLLTDVGEGDQYMTYVKGSHTLYHDFEKFEKSRLSLDYCKEKNMKDIEVIKCLGKAGDVFIFDPNGVHSGNRTTGNDRDTFVISYTTDHSYVWRQDVPQEGLKTVALPENKNPFRQILAAKEKHSKDGLFPHLKSWVGSLPALTSWV